MECKTLFGTLPDGREVWKITLQNRSGARVELLNLGAAIHGVWVPDRRGALQNVTLSYSDVERYFHTRTFAGAVCGRVANRVGGARFVSNHQTWMLTANDGENQLHGGPDGFYRKLWDMVCMENAVRFSLESPDGEAGYPGNLSVSVTYRWREDNCLSIDYEALSDQDTICNLTNHAHWNLGGYDGADALAQTIELEADFFTPIDRDVLPTGEIAPVRGAMDLRAPKEIGAGKRADDPQIRLVDGYDHNFVLRAHDGKTLVRAACLRDAGSGRQLEVFTTMPGIQFFSGSVQKEGPTGVALETQFFPDAMRHWWFPSIVLRARAHGRSRTEYRFSVR